MKGDLWDLDLLPGLSLDQTTNIPSSCEFHTLWYIMFCIRSMKYRNSKPCLYSHKLSISPNASWFDLEFDDLHPISNPTHSSTSSKVGKSFRQQMTTWISLDSHRLRRINAGKLHSLSPQDLLYVNVLFCVCVCVHTLTTFCFLNDIGKVR